ncbi:unnamed protein product [Plutella xylostella]|uniref:(diamondback moth) hypothetical protein n=1 Tax=Plutella xylostella TaxID=51655 RepID=A0A8S4FV89_PLUXY|nr:unnamed protein product [Plutella xylostella]
MIPVTGDACWSKRSYGTNYCASSGAGAIVGMYSKKVLHYGVKNKVCTICSRANKKALDPPDHICFKNFDGPSTAMEAAIITEGFKSSLDDHGLIYNQKMENIKNDIINGPYHIFGDHSKCASYFCTDAIKKQSENMVPELKVHGVFQQVEDLAHRLSLHAYSFAYNVTNNLVESYNARVAMFVGGKRVNFTQRRSYAGRCAGAVISYNSGAVQTTVHNYIFGTEANPEIVRLENIRNKLNVKRIEKSIKKKKVFKQVTNKDAHYGDACIKVDMDDEEYKRAKTDFLLRLEITAEEKDKIEQDTILQSASPLWLETRRKLLTASWFSTVCKRRPSTNCTPLVKQILYGTDLSNVPSIKHGKNNEYTALRELEQALNTKISQCGLSIDKEFSFLGASPDGKCDLGIIEVKCPSSAYKMDPEEAIRLKKVDFWKYASNKLVVNRNHKWFYQIQGQLRITGQNTCIFAIWTGPGNIKYELINKDDQFWKEKMEIPLIRFYKNCLLPELIDPRFNRNMPLREHSSHSHEHILMTNN